MSRQPRAALLTPTLLAAVDRIDPLVFALIESEIILSPAINSIAGCAKGFLPMCISRSSTPACPIARAVHTTLESLESRRMMANDPLTVGVLRSGTALWLNVIGSANDDAIVVAQTARTSYAISNGTWSLTRTGAFTGVRVTAGLGNDSVTIAGVWATRTSVLGEAGDDTLRGGIGADLMLGGAGNDSIDGGAGNDTLLGELGDDNLNGRAGSDSLTGGDGDDTVDGDVGDDRLVATLDTGNDLYIGGAGVDSIDYTGRAVPLVLTLDGQANDGATGEADNVGSDLESVSGGNASDSITGDDTAHTLYGGAGNDTIIGGGAADRIFGGAGADSLSGGAGNDSIWGQADGDQLFGNDGEDFLDGGLANDALDGGDGNDHLIALGGGTSDSITGGNGLDSFWLDSDPTESITDISSNETAAHAEHRVQAFVNYGRTAISKEINGQKFAEPSGVGKVVNFANNKLFADGGPSIDDIHQGQAGDCWYLCTLSALAKVSPETIRQSITNLGDGTYAARFINPANGSEQYVRVDADLYTYTWSSTLQSYATTGTQGSLWAPLLEKALTWVRGSRLGTYATITSGWMSEASTRLGVASINSSPGAVGSVGGMVNWLRDQLDANKAVTIGTPGVQAGVNLVSGHAYMVDHIVDHGDGTYDVVLRNPWGVDGRGSDGSNDGYVTLTALQLYANCSGMSAAA